MNPSAPSRADARRAPKLVLVGLVVVIASIIGTLAHLSASSSAFWFIEILRGNHGASTPGDDGAVTEDDGALPDGVTVFDDQYPGIGNLDPALLQALRDATTAAAEKGIELHVNSGWRSAEYQAQLHREAVSEYGSEESAARWVATANTSAHVSGNAVDIGPFDAASWLAQYGARYGLCQTYPNESWHYELRPEATSGGCPPIGSGPMRGPPIAP